MFNVFTLIAAVLNFYAFVCFIRIVLTWFPRAAYSKIGRFFSSVCDPYLNLFRRFRFTRIGGLDFSPMLAILLLYALAAIVSDLSLARTLSVGYILASVIRLLWSFVSSIANFFIVVLILRLVIFLVMRRSSRNSYNSYGSFWDSFDRVISPFVFKVSGVFSKRSLSWTKALTIAIIVSILAMLLAGFLVRIVCGLLMSLPF